MTVILFTICYYQIQFYFSSFVKYFFLHSNVKIVLLFNQILIEIYKQIPNYML